MPATKPTPMLDARYSDPTAIADPWSAVLEVLESAPIFWLSTVSAEGEPHVTPLIAVWHDGGLWFCTGREEQKWRNLATNAACVMTTANNDYTRGFDVTVRGEAMQVVDQARLAQVAHLYVGKYGDDWRFEVRDGSFWHAGHVADVFCVRPRVVHVFRRDPVASQTRWTFEERDGHDADDRD